MDFFVQYIIPYILAYKYLAIFTVSFFAAFIVPIPSGSLLMATAGFASVGYFNFKLIIIISILGNIIGDNLSYWWARIYGKKIFSYIGFRKIIRSRTFSSIEHKFRQHPGAIVFLSRFEVLSTLSVNILAGIGKVPYRKYLMYESIGSISQVLFYGSIGYIFGYNWQSANNIISRILLLILFVLIFLIFKYKKSIVKYLKSK